MDIFIEPYREYWFIGWELFFELYLNPAFNPLRLKDYSRTKTSSSRSAERTWRTCARTCSSLLTTWFNKLWTLVYPWRILRRWSWWEVPLECQKFKRSFKKQLEGYYSRSQLLIIARYTHTLCLCISLNITFWPLHR